MGTSSIDTTILLVESSSCLLAVSDWINIASMIVNASIALWIVKTIQNKINNKRVLKDYFIEEVKDIRNQYREYIAKLVDKSIHPRNVTSWHKMMSIKISELMKDLKNAYGFDENLLDSYKNELRNLITENEDFMNQYNKDNLELTHQSITSIIKFQQDNANAFSQLIISINEK